LSRYASSLSSSTCGIAFMGLIIFNREYLLTGIS
jgi:hypothetical protein